MADGAQCQGFSSTEIKRLPMVPLLISCDGGSTRRHDFSLLLGLPIDCNSYLICGLTDGH